MGLARSDDVVLLGSSGLRINEGGAAFIGGRVGIGLLGSSFITLL